MKPGNVRDESFTGEESSRGGSAAKFRKKPVVVEAEFIEEAS